MIESFVHKGIQLFFETGSKKGIQPIHAKKLRNQLTALDTAVKISDMKIPGWDLHELSGARKGEWSISVNGNWRMTFTFQNGNAFVVDYEDYH